MHHPRAYSSTSIVGINTSLVQPIMYSRCLADSLLPHGVLYCPASAAADDGPHLHFMAQKRGLQASKMGAVCEKGVQSKEHLRLCLDSNCHCFGGCKQCGGRASANHGTTAQDKSSSKASGRASASATAKEGCSSNMGVEHMRCPV
jgi:hypothetical protein